MCGIAGFISPGGEPLTLGSVPAVLEQLEHRGPDDQGFLTYTKSGTRVGREWTNSVPEAEVVFLHRRLSIIDLSDAARQPMRSSDSRYYITFNGEIYNYRELRQELEALGHRFRTCSDTEVLLAAYAAWGPGALQRLVGMFAFAILDTKRRSVFLARDFFGIKPLYYSHANGGIVFASELKALLEAGNVSRRVNACQLFSYLRHGLCDAGEETLLSDVLQLPPAHYLDISLDTPAEIQPVRYWEPAEDSRDDLSFEQAAEQLRYLFLESVGLHLRSDVPVGSALSGGIDSSSVVMAVRHLEPEIELHTFSYIAEDNALSEEKWVDVVARAAGAQVHKVYPNASRLIADFDQLPRAQDIPWASTSPYAQFCVFEAAREAGIKVMLDGQGADEILGGYSYFRGARLASLLRQKKWGQAANFLASARRWPGSSAMHLLQHASGYLLPMAAQAPLRKIVDRDLMPSWMNREWFVRNGVVLRSTQMPYESADVLREKLRRELCEHLPSLLRYEDRNSMAFSIESRVPFLTPELVNFILSLPEDYIIARDGTSKAVFRRAMRGIVPEAILDRRDKIGFNTPERAWLSAAGQWIRQKFNAEAAAGIPALRLDEVRSDWQKIEQGQKRFSYFLWRCLNVIAWTEKFQIQYS